MWSLEEEGDNLVSVEFYERTVGREVNHAGQYDRKLTTTPDEIVVRMPNATEDDVPQKTAIFSDVKRGCVLKFNT